MVLAARAAASTVPVWIDLLSNWLANVPLVLLIVGRILVVLPAYKPAAGSRGVAPWTG
jgi:hypothetical protein